MLYDDPATKHSLYIGIDSKFDLMADVDLFMSKTGCKKSLLGDGRLSPSAKSPVKMVKNMLKDYKQI